MTEHSVQNAFIGRQPILDRHQQLFAYELLFRNDNAVTSNMAKFSDSTQATATVITNAFAEIAMSEVLGPYQGFIKVDEEFLHSDLIVALPPHQVVLEILDAVPLSAETIQRCDQLRRAGFILTFRATPETYHAAHPLIPFTEVIKLDATNTPQPTLETLIRHIKPLGKTLLAEKVETATQMQLCQTLGFHLFQGFFFAKPTIIHGKRIQSSHLSLLNLLSLLSQDADISDIETALKQEPTLTLHLLRLTNSAGSGLATRITSLRHAITILGRRQLLRWIQLLLYSNQSQAGESINPLLQLAATRGRLMELLVEKADPSKEKSRDVFDQAYMVGILSLLPALMGSPMQDIIDSLPLPSEVILALTGGENLLGSLLSLIEALEEQDLTKVLQTSQKLPSITPDFANLCLLQAMGWANRLAEEAA